ncbi:MAG TPA: pectinesterase family protein [Opitutaceae bacterium]|nr:pectinesterase family protein [Opitutaceae bacterium]
MRTPSRLPLLLAVVLSAAPTLVRAQDRVAPGAEPIVASIDVSKLTYDYLVDGDLAADDSAHHAYRTLQAAYAAAPAGTEAKPTVIGIKPNVYFLPGGAPRTPSLSIRKNYITLLGLTNDRRTVVLADNRGLMQGADDDGYIIDVNADGFIARNLTIINYCNTDYEYPGNPAKNLKKRSDVITQAVALQAAGDKHVYDNVALLSRLDTMFLRTTRSYFHNVYIEGTDDWVGGGRISVWEDCTLVYPTGSGVMSASNVVFIRCHFEAARGMEFYKAEFRGADRPDALIDCIVPVSTPTHRVAWIRGRVAPRPPHYSLTYHTKDANGNPAVICDATVGPPRFAYSRELGDREARAYTPRNLLRAAPNAAPDNWNPTGAPSPGEGAGAQVYRMELTGGNVTIRTGGAGATLAAKVLPADASDAAVRWSTDSHLVVLKQTDARSVVVTGRNTTERAEWVPIQATAANGFRETAYVNVEPHYVAAPRFTVAPAVGRPADGVVSLTYALDSNAREDQSIVSWYACDDAAGAHGRLAAVSRGNAPLKTLTLTPGMVGKYLKVSIRPKYSISDPGPAVDVVAAQRVAASDVPSPDVSPDFRSFVSETNPTFADGWWTVQGTWAVVAGDAFEHGWGIHATSPGALLYQRDAPCGDMRIDLVMTPEKTEGTGFSIPGSPADSGERNLHADIYIKYDPRTRTGYALRYWRTTKSAAKCMFQFYRIVDGAGSPVDDHQVLSGVFKPKTHLTITATGPNLTAVASNNVDGETLRLESAIEPNSFGGAGVSWPRGSTNVYSRIAIHYGAPAK